MVPEVLSQSEIDNLLNALTSGETDVESISRAHAEKKVKIYDFRRPDKFSKDQLRAIQMIQTKGLSHVRGMIRVHFKGHVDGRRMLVFVFDFGFRQC